MRQINSFLPRAQHREERNQAMIGEQFFVGGVAGLLGLLALWASIQNHDRYYQLPKIRWIEDRWGRTRARIFYAVLGIALLAVAVYVSLGLHEKG